MALSDQLHIEKRAGYHLVIDPVAPNWLAANDDGAWVIRQLRAGRSRDEVSRRYAKRCPVSLREALHQVGRFAEEVADFVSGEGRPPYRGRSQYLTPDRLTEVWLHVTDRCNLTCRHCLVSSSPAGKDGLPTENLRKVIREASELGAETFYFTGGEPLLRRDLLDLLREVIGTYGATAVVMTNGTLLDRELAGRLSELPREGLFLQVSVDGSCADRNDAVRSPGSFDMAVRGLREGTAAGLNLTVASVVLRKNLDDLVPLASLVRDLGVEHLHLMWQHVRERGGFLPRPALRQLTSALSSLTDHAKSTGLIVDNIENLRRVVNGDPKVKYDLSNACWDSLAIYRDGRVFPSACLVGIDSESAGSVPASSLRDIWLESEAFAARRERSVIDSPAADGDPFLFLHGGGDPEQAFFAGNGDGGIAVDPYLPLHRAMARAMIDEIVAERRALLASAPPGPMVYDFMGDDGYGCPSEAGVRNGGDHRVDFVHSNCVLIQDVIAKSRAQIRDYYGAAAREPKTEICFPFEQDQRYLTHIPDEVIARSYGCGSPVFKAELQPEETVVDLGSGAGLECFIASRLVGPKGRVIGVDMTDEMLRFATGVRPQVAEKLGYDNVVFQSGLLEALPIDDGEAEVVISNCVINLSPEKLRVLAEIRRVLKPGGRLVFSDIVSERALPPEIRFNPRLKGECIAGALTEKKLLSTLEKLGFLGVQVLQKVPWRTVDEVPFSSVTVRAWRPSGAPSVSYTYPGPFRSVVLDSGHELTRGIAAEVPPSLLSALMDGNGALPSGARSVTTPRLSRDCMVCGAPLVYLDDEESLTCHYCGRLLPANARCQENHFVCDECHTEDHVEFTKSFCAHAHHTDPIALFSELRRSHLFPLHGPEHHALVPAAFLTAYRNVSGGESLPRLEAAIERGAKLPGGTCAYWGGCAAALGIGIAYSTILHATPLSHEVRGHVQLVVASILAEIGRFGTPRCCRRESLLALKMGCELSGRYLPHAVTAGAPPPCDQTALNRECLGAECPFHPDH